MPAATSGGRSALLALAGLVTLTACARERSSESAPEESRSAGASLRVTEQKHGVLIETQHPLRAKVPQALDLRVFDDAVKRDEELSAIEGAPLHLVIVDRGLRWFQHLHPVKTAGGYSATVTFPHDGTYAAFNYYKPVDSDAQVARSDLQIGRSIDAPLPLQSTPRSLRQGRNVVELLTTPEPVPAGEWTTVTFRVSDAGQAVELNIPSVSHHLVIISENARDLLYGHSTLGEASGGMRGAMHLPVDGLHQDESIHTPILDGRISYHVRYPHPGRYKAWLEVPPLSAPVGFVIDVVRPKPSDPDRALRPAAGT